MVCMKSCGVHVWLRLWQNLLFSKEMKLGWMLEWLACHCHVRFSS